jgi:hypothetical protein
VATKNLCAAANFVWIAARVHIRRFGVVNPWLAVPSSVENEEARMLRSGDAAMDRDYGEVLNENITAMHDAYSVHIMGRAPAGPSSCDHHKDAIDA